MNGTKLSTLCGKQAYANMQKTLKSELSPGSIPMESYGKWAMEQRHNKGKEVRKDSEYSFHLSSYEMRRMLKYGVDFDELQKYPSSFFDHILPSSNDILRLLINGEVKTKLTRKFEIFSYIADNDILNRETFDLIKNKSIFSNNEDLNKYEKVLSLWVYNEDCLKFLNEHSIDIKKMLLEYESATNFDESNKINLNIYFEDTRTGNQIINTISSDDNGNVSSSYIEYDKSGVQVKSDEMEKYDFDKENLEKFGSLVSYAMNKAGLAREKPAQKIK